MGPGRRGCHPPILGGVARPNRSKTASRRNPSGLKKLLDLLERLALGLGQEEGGRHEIHDRAAANPKNTVEYPYRPTVGRNVAAMVVDTAWLTRSAMLIPFERMRVGISSDSASHTQTPGPAAKKAMKEKVKSAVSQPLRSLGTGLMSAFSILSGAVRA
jgi:hypothetical protein